VLFSGCVEDAELKEAFKENRQYITEEAMVYAANKLGKLDLAS
jgi:hypothetical protein